MCAAGCTPDSSTCNSRSAGWRAELHQEIAKVHERAGELSKEITVQTRWLVTVMVAASILFLVMQKVLATIFL